MGKNNLSNTSIEEHKCKELRILINERLKPAPGCCIYRVPKSLRKINGAAYTPQYISIGPFHHGKKDLVEMEKQKVRYKREFGERIGINESNKWESLITFIKDNEQKVRDCYAETCKLQSLEFITMILYDSIFIIEVFLKRYHRKENEFLLHNWRLRSGIRVDLLLLENQLPYFVLEKLYNLAFASPTGEVSPPFIYLACKFLKCSVPDPVATEDNLKHFVDLRRHVLVKNRPTSTSIGDVRDLPTAVKLHEAGLKFRNIKKDDCWLDIKFQKRKARLPCFNVNELYIPHIKISDGTERLIRNMMALEQCHYPFDTHVCDYVFLMDCLIDTEKDVNLLIEKGIISNHIGEHAAIAKMFNKLCLEISTTDSCYKDISDNLNAHYNKWWNRTMGTLISVYFSNLWRGTGTVAAVVLLVLTLLQTIYTMRT